jgi:hypothetical protein
LRAFAFLDVEDDDEPGERIDLASLSQRKTGQP